MTKNQQISAAILNHVASGKSVQEAYDAVFGAGSYVKMAGEIYDQINAK